MPWMVVEIDGQSELLFVSKEELCGPPGAEFAELPAGVRDADLVDPPAFLREWLERHQGVDKLVKDLPPDDPRPEADKEPEKLRTRPRPPRRTRFAPEADVRVLPNLGQPWLTWHERDVTPADAGEDDSPMRRDVHGRPPR